MTREECIWIPGRMPCLNDMLAAAKSGHGRRNAYSRMKNMWTRHVASHVLAARLEPFEPGVKLDFLWTERDRRRDPDNIAAAKKFVIDGLVKSGLLGGDGWPWICSWSDAWTLDSAISLGDGGVRVCITQV